MYEVDTVALKKQRASQDVQRWELSFGTVGTADTQVDIFLGSVVGVQSTETMIMPQLPQVDAASTVNSTSIALPGSTAAGSTTAVISSSATLGLVPKGSFVKFSNHDKVYVTKTDTDFSGGDPTMSFYPKLRVALTSANLLLVGASVDLTFYRAIDSQKGITFTDGVLSNVGTITVIEAL